VHLKRPDDFIALAKRGLFVFDWRDVYRSMLNVTNSYELIARPTRPLTMGVVSRDISMLAPVRLERIEFSLTESLDVEKNIQCVSR